MGRRESGWQRRAFARRRVLAAGVGATVWLAACGGDSKQDPARGASSVAPGGSGTAPSATARPSVRGSLEAARTRGGVLRTTGYDPLTLDTFDPHQTQFGPIYATHAAVFSRLLTYLDHHAQEIAPDLASELPEQPDRTTYLLKLHPEAKFHGKAPVNGRAVTAADVKFSIERQVSNSSPKRDLYYRRHQWETVDKIETPDARTVRITTRGPTAPFLHFLADFNAFIVPPEVVTSGDEMNAPDKLIGSGPFQLEKFETLQQIRLTRNAAWHNANQPGLPPGRPFLDAIEIAFALQNDTATEAALRARQIDHAGVGDKTTADRVRPQVPGLHLSESPQAGGAEMRLFVAGGPLRDARLRQALSIAVDRQAMGQTLFQGFFRQSGPVGWAIQKWALPQDELLKKPGYRLQKAERDADIAEAKKLWQAGGGESVGELTMIYANQPESLPRYFPQLQKNLSDVLGLRLKGEVDPTGYTTLAQAMLEQQQTKALRYPLTFGYDNGWLDLDDWLYPYFHSRGPKNSFAVADPKIDQLLASQRAEFDEAKRRQLGMELQHYLLDSVVPRVNLMQDVERRLVWSYVKNPWHARATWFGMNHMYANTWLDTSDSNWSGRPQ